MTRSSLSPILLAPPVTPQLNYYFAPKGFRNQVLSSGSGDDFGPAVAVDGTRPLGALASAVEILVCITLYNEDGDALLYSLAAIQQNINYLVDIGREDIAAGITVCIIADGHSTLADSMAALVSRLGLYEPESLDQKAELHVFENRLSALALHEQIVQHRDIGQPSSWQAVYSAAGYDRERLITSHPATMITPRTFFCLKPENAGKLNSHWWFFKTFCTYLQPQYCVQMDVGSVPQEHTLYTLRRHLEKHPAVGAATNSLLTREPSSGWDILSVWQYTNFAFTNLIHSPAEELSGYVSVMCGQFSLFRWQALNNGSLNRQQHHDSHSRRLFPNGESPLERYLEEPEQLSLLEANRLLTEDRVLCLALKTNRRRRWKLSYVPNAITITDTCATLAELQQQRRRWTNGAFSCRLSLLSAMIQSLRSPRINLVEKWDLLRALPLYASRTLLDWFHPAISWTVAIGVFQLTLNAADTLGWSGEWLYVAFGVEMILSVARIILCLLGRLTDSFLSVSVVYISAYMVLVLGLLCLSGNFWLLAAIASAWVGAYVSALSYSPNLATKAAQYFIPMVITDAVITPPLKAYAGYNISDASWGTKGRVGKRGYKWERRYLILGGVISNGLLFAIALSHNLFIPVFIFQFSPWIIGAIAGTFVGLQARRRKRIECLRKVFSPMS